MSEPPEKSLAERAAEGARKLDDAARSRNAEDEAYEREQRKRLDALFAMACDVGWWSLRFGRGRKIIADERAWVTALPFVVNRYEYFFQSGAPSVHWAILLNFVGEPPDAALLQPLFGNVAPGVSVSTTRTFSTGPFQPYAKLDLPVDFHASSNRLHALRLLFHRVVDEVLRPLHAEYPLASVEPRYDRDIELH